MRLDKRLEGLAKGTRGVYNGQVLVVKGLSGTGIASPVTTITIDKGKYREARVKFAKHTEDLFRRK